MAGGDRGRRCPYIIIEKADLIERRNTMKRVSFWQFALIFLLFSACGASRTYLVDLKYVPQTPPGLKAKPKIVAVAPFIDMRSHKNDVGIGKKRDGSVDRYTTAPITVSEGVKKAVEKFLRNNGLEVVEIQEWDLKPESLSKIDAEMVVGGQINRFWSQADSMTGRTLIKTELELVVYVGKPQERKVLSQKIEMDREITQIIFSSGKIEEILNESLSEIIESAFAKLLALAKMQNPAFISQKT